MSAISVNFPMRAVACFAKKQQDDLSCMHTACVLCVFWAHASDFMTLRPFLIRLVWSAFE